MDDEVLERARRHAAVLHSVGLPRAAAETEAACALFTSSGRPELAEDEPAPLV